MKGIKREVWVLGFVSLFNDISTHMVFPLLPLFLTSTLGAGAAALGLIEGIAEFMSKVLKTFSGHASDRTGKLRIYLFSGYLLSVFSRPFYAVASSWVHVLAVRSFDRVGKGIRDPPRDALISHYTSRKYRGRAFGLHRALDTAGAVIGPLLAFAVLGIGLSYRQVFLIALIPGAAAVSFLFLVREKKLKKKKKSLTASLKGLSPSMKWFLTASAVFGAGYTSVAFLVLFLSTELSIQNTLLLYILLNLVYSLSSLPIGFLADRFGLKKTLVAGFALYSAIMAGFAFSPFLAPVFFVLFGVFRSLYDGVSRAYASVLSSAGERGLALGAYETVTGVSGMAASIIFGALWQVFCPAVAFTFSAALAITAAFLLHLRKL